MRSGLAWLHAEKRLSVANQNFLPVAVRKLQTIDSSQICMNEALAAFRSKRIVGAKGKAIRSKHRIAAIHGAGNARKRCVPIEHVVIVESASWLPDRG